MNNPDWRSLCAELLETIDMLLEGDRRPEGERGAYIRSLLAQPEPAVVPVAVGVTDEELTLVYAYAVAAAVGNRRGPFKREDAEAAQLAGLRAVLTRYAHPAIQPVPVSERLPGPEDCDSEGRCWVGYAVPKDDLDTEYNPSWELCKVHPQDEVWLPHWAMPVPNREGDQ